MYSHELWFLPFSSRVVAKLEMENNDFKQSRDDDFYLLLTLAIVTFLHGAANMAHPAFLEGLIKMFNDNAGKHIAWQEPKLLSSVNFVIFLTSEGAEVMIQFLFKVGLPYLASDCCEVKESSCYRSDVQIPDQSISGNK